MTYANEWKLEVSLNQNVDWKSTNPTLEKALKAIREKFKGHDTILSTSFVFKFDCLKPDCQMEYAEVEIPQPDWSKEGESFSFSTNADVDKDAKEVMVSVSAAFNEHFDKPKVTFKVEKDGSTCVLLNIKVAINRRLGGEISVRWGGVDVPLLGGQDPPSTLFVEGKIRICCCVCEEQGEVPPKGGDADKAESTGVASKCDYHVSIHRWDTGPGPNDAKQLYWECKAPLGSCGKPKKVSTLPVVSIESGMKK
jgi:hypothetical protein